VDPTGQFGRSSGCTPGRLEGSAYSGETRAARMVWAVGMGEMCCAWHRAAGQQGPILAAAGARVTVLDNSPRQLSQDRMVAERDGLEINHRRQHDGIVDV
jgi:hypothetical protein